MRGWVEFYMLFLQRNGILTLVILAVLLVRLLLRRLPKIQLSALVSSRDPYAFKAAASVAVWSAQPLALYDAANQWLTAFDSSEAAD